MNNAKNLLLIFIALTLALVIALYFKKQPKPAIKEQSMITEKAIVHNLTQAQQAPQTKQTEQTKMVTTASGLQYEDKEVGTGASPVKGKKVTVHYTGTLENGKKFDSSVDRNQPFTFIIGIGQVIKGWDEGVMSMKVGGKRRLVIPAVLGYGSQNVGGGMIPANSTLIFDVELLKVD